MILLVFVCFSGMILAQTITVTGIVTDEDGEGMPGVTVLVKGTSLGIATDVDGKYRLGVPEDATTLVFSYLGYLTQEVEIGNQSVINVVLEPDATSLDLSKWIAGSHSRSCRYP